MHKSCCWSHTSNFQWSGSPIGQVCSGRWGRRQTGHQTELHLISDGGLLVTEVFLGAAGCLKLLATCATVQLYRSFREYFWTGRRSSRQSHSHHKAEPLVCIEGRVNGRLLPCWIDFPDQTISYHHLLVFSIYCTNFSQEQGSQTRRWHACPNSAPACPMLIWRTARK